MVASKWRCDGADACRVHHDLVSRLISSSNDMAASSPSPRRVLLVHDSHEFGGLEIVIIEFLRRLGGMSRRRCWCAVTRTPTGPARPSSSTRSERSACPSCGPHLPLGKASVNRVREMLDTWRAIRRFRPDIVHVHSATVEGGRTQTLLAKLAMAPIVVRTEHNSPPPSAASRSAHGSGASAMLRPRPW